MSEPSSLSRLISLWGRNLPVLVCPPGSVGLVALIIAIAGWEIGLNMPYAVSDILAVRSMGAVAMGVAQGETGWQQAFAALYSTIKAMPSPSMPAVLSAIVTATVLLVAAGGWINTSLALLRGERPSEAAWWEGVKRSWISTLWFLIIIGMACGALVASAVFGTAVLRGAMTGTLAPGAPTMAAAGGSLAFFALAAASAFYGIAVTSLTGIVAIAEPRTPFFQLPRRARRIFHAADGWRFLRQFSVVLTGWVLLKTLVYQLVIPFSPVAAPYSQAVSAGGALLYTAVSIGDGLFLLLGILMAAQAYQRGREIA